MLNCICATTRPKSGTNTPNKPDSFISRNARSCPHCGEPWKPFAPEIFYIAAILFTIIGVLALLGTSLVASLDEWHQSYLPNRTGSVWDALLDCTGSIALQLAVYIYMRLMRPKRLIREV